jgi:hypothetical protein
MRASPTGHRLVWVATGLLVLVLAAAASAHRPPTTTEFRGISLTITTYTRHFFCPTAAAVDVSTKDPRWAAAFAISDCGSGSVEDRFYLRRATRTANVWRVVQDTSSHGVGTAPGPPCATSLVPADIRCGVRGRS